MQPLQPGHLRTGNASNQQPANGYRTPANTWLDKEHVMEYMRIGPRTLQKWRTEGIIPHYRIKGRIYYRESDLEDLLEKNKRIGLNRDK